MCQYSCIILRHSREKCLSFFSSSGGDFKGYIFEYMRFKTLIYCYVKIKWSPEQRMSSHCLCLCRYLSLSWFVYKVSISGLLVSGCFWLYEKSVSVGTLLFSHTHFVSVHLMVICKTGEMTGFRSGERLFWWNKKTISRDPFHVIRNLTYTT